MFVKGNRIDMFLTASIYVRWFFKTLELYTFMKFQTIQKVITLINKLKFNSFFLPYLFKVSFLTMFRLQSYIFKSIFCLNQFERNLFFDCRLEEGKGKVAFEQTMKHLLHAISGMMLHTSDNTLLAQVIIKNYTN